MNEISSTVARRQAIICLELVVETDRCVIERRQSADRVLAGFYRRHREYGARDRRFFSNAVFSWFRWRGWLKTPTPENIAAAILLDATEIPPPLKHMIEHPSLSHADLKPLGQLNLNDKAAGLRNLLKCGPLSLEQLVPEWVPDFLYIPDSDNVKDNLAQCIGAFQVRPPTWLRLRSNQRNETLHSLTKMGIEIGTHPFMEQAVFIKGSKNCDLSQLPGAEAQDLASQCVGMCCNPKPGEQWWDVCAGAGGKSLHLTDLMKDKGLILATDIRPLILDELSKRLKKNKCRSIKMALWNGAAAPDKYFDGVLVDAPCSGMGTWHRNPDARWRISIEQIRNYADVQANLLQIAAAKVKSGGRLVYSTCTLTAVENTDVIRRFLERQKEFHPENILNPLNREQSNGMIWIWPGELNCNGMFIAVMKKD